MPDLSAPEPFACPAAAPHRAGGAVSEAVVTRLRAAGCVFAEDEATLLLAAAPGADVLDVLVARRVDGEPLEHLLGWVAFDGLRVPVDPGVFVPRRRTEFLVQLAAPLLTPGSLAVDLCCGCGAVGIALRARVPGVEVHAADLDPAAVACAARTLPDVHEGDLYDALPPALRGRVTVLAVNAPYVPTDAIALMPPEARDHEPRLALDGGPDGVALHRRVAAHARDWLAPNGHLLIETSHEQATSTADAFRAAGLTATTHHDEDRHATVVVGTRADH
ncbi:Protein-N(5)-glutamine methyltransferase PrmC, methylates polypeptide chain release factors RF1 and RF2 [Actinokineospora spheciospongiae]|uniref:peptide chain release factor N(5)-glutamine methyltransferase n=1 Tax=Actinokineospora spheciospongiae TaxID=909613 RepID=W7IYM7_9PSEU|nr:Protein-N(5)-glutamine methyltransferase PrmC, methylates polypeptide chain release factors RF1 and RF2 [Actinokineospora spheciospongiae]